MSALEILASTFTVLFTGLWQILENTEIPYFNCTAETLVVGIFIMNVAVIAFNLIISKDGKDK